MTSLKQIDFTNFHDATQAVFTTCETPIRPPDFVSASGSVYWDTGEGVIRQADHWGEGIRTCRWFYFDPANLGVSVLRMAGGCLGEASDAAVRAGFCAYSDFADRWATDTMRKRLIARYADVLNSFWKKPATLVAAINQL